LIIVLPALQAQVWKRPVSEKARIAFALRSRQTGFDTLSKPIAIYFLCARSCAIRHKTCASIWLIGLLMIDQRILTLSAYPKIP
jgi:hypothetical protein